MQLQDLCVGVVANNISTQPCLPVVPENLQNKVVDLLALDLDLEQAGTVRIHKLAIIKRHHHHHLNPLCFSYQGGLKAFYEASHEP
jgi:hypothetical protein